MKRFLLLAALSILVDSIYAQRLTGKVTNAETGEILPYVNIGIVGSPYGTVSGLQGEFELYLPENEFVTDSIQFSSVGFESRKLAKNSTATPLFLEIKLQPTDTKLAEVVVKPSFKNYETQGNDNIKTKNATNLALSDRPNQNLGSAIGRKFRAKRTAQLEKFRFFIAYNDFDTVHFRINVYELSDGKPGAFLNRENILVELFKHKQGWVTVDLLKYQIKVDDNFAVSAEWVYASGKGKLLRLPITIPSIGATHFYKYGSQNAWKKFSQMSSCMEVTLAW